ncbi:AcrR family transcriptional regulator [Mycobacterium frederiksbergense]|uniref:AcrR family transcriptional regulator n=1 Tax=Mycolicibacterium frederiksbergense TaxID=117567 RepID=A0ABT6KX19_9MYCO|nr:hypothetical protein [Mycolicibacterium frederiksbergense]MDH6195266.1 AcrR family transcriptional regulator [Mycolicibacterium frederiksbergense]
MPVEVDESARLAEIARATVAVARERGTRGITVRAVADQLGRSTAFITYFVPSRAQLIVNALAHAQVNWERDRADHLGDMSGVGRLVALARWMCSSSAEDDVLRCLWIEAIADVRSDNRAAYNILRATTDLTYDEFLRSAEDVDRTEATEIADILYLYGRGYHVKSVEDPESWTDQRVNRALEVLIRALLTEPDGSTPTESAMT